jgi:hypothetical protein
MPHIIVQLTVVLCLAVACDDSCIVHPPTHPVMFFLPTVLTIWTTIGTVIFYLVIIPFMHRLYSSLLTYLTPYMTHTTTDTSSIWTMTSS